MNASQTRQLSPDPPASQSEPPGESSGAVEATPPRLKHEPGRANLTPLSIECAAGASLNGGQAESRPRSEENERKTKKKQAKFESLLDGFALLRLAQLINFDIYYINFKNNGDTSSYVCSLGSANLQTVPEISSELDVIEGRTASGRCKLVLTTLKSLASCLKILLSFAAIIVSIDKTLSTILLCLFSRNDTAPPSGHLDLVNKTADRPNSIMPPKVDEAANVSLGWVTLIVMNLSSTLIIFSTVFNGHLLWELLGQRLFLVERKFQYKIMLSLLSMLILLQYLTNCLFVNNLFGWSFQDQSEAQQRLMAQHLRETADDHRSTLDETGLTYAVESIGHQQTSNAFLFAQQQLNYRNYFVLAKLKVFVTEHDEHNSRLNLLLALVQFARGIICIGPYVTINYCIICMKKHIETIRNQSLLIESLKRRERLRLVLSNSSARRSRSTAIGASLLGTPSSTNVTPLPTISRQECDLQERKLSSLSSSPFGKQRGRKRVIFVTESSLATRTESWSPRGIGEDEGGLAQQNSLLASDALSQMDNLSPTASMASSRLETPSAPLSRRRHSPSLVSIGARSMSSLSDGRISQLISRASSERCCSSATIEFDRAELAAGGDLLPTGRAEAATRGPAKERGTNSVAKYSQCVKDFNELEENVTKLYVFAGRLNRLMGRLGLAIFFIAHNLLISCSLIVPEAICIPGGACNQGADSGALLVNFVRAIVIFVGIVPFVCGQLLGAQLEKLSKQIDRIIILQRINSTRRDHLVRTRELLSDIQLNCAGMLVFNVENGVFKYLLIAFASAFFVEQRGKWSLLIAAFSKSSICCARAKRQPEELPQRSLWADLGCSNSKRRKWRMMLVCDKAQVAQYSPQLSSGGTWRDNAHAN